LPFAVCPLVTAAAWRPRTSRSRTQRWFRRCAGASGAVIGKTGMHEFAFWVTSNNPWHRRVRHPRDPSRSPGGSSGGSDRAVAVGLSDWALGTDTVGSIRIRAALCVVVGFKPTFGRISLEGIEPLSSSMDTVGPIALTVDAAAHAMQVLLNES
jgi:Asp-tRNA(Asn)/Glu-tRNA(Gln) amidotransferase A subunit family amidase